MSEPFKLDQVKLDTAEPFTFEWDDETYTCTDPNATDVRRVRDLLQMAESDPAATLEYLVGAEQYRRLDEAEGVLTMTHLKALSEAWAAHHGLDVGKSSGSPKSSKRTVMR